MNFCELSKIYKNTSELHHAYLIEGNKDEVCISLVDFLKDELEILTQGNPDFWREDFDTFGIDDGRHLKEKQSNRALNGGKKIFIISFNFITVEAQNSLLKIFEEPTENTHFFIITPSVENILPTLKSRLIILGRSPRHGGVGRPSDSFAEDFLSSNFAERLEFVKKFTNDDGKNKSDTISFLINLEIALREKIPPQKIDKEEIFIFEEIFKCKKFLNSRSASVKMILEHLSLIIPRF